jgi:hypothetical protein
MREEQELPDSHEPIWSRAPFMPKSLAVTPDEYKGTRRRIKRQKNRKEQSERKK